MLKCKINTKEFQEGLKKVEVATTNKLSLPILGNIKLIASKDQLQLIGTDLENYMTITINDVGVEIEGETVIKNIKDIIKSFKFMKESYTEIKVDNNDNITITNGSRNIKLLTDNVEEYPKGFEVGEIDNQYSYNTKTLHNRIKKVNFARMKGDIRPILEGIYFNESDIVALDGFRVALSNDPLLRINDSFIIASGTVNILLKTLNNKVKNEIRISNNKKYVMFEYDNVKIISRLLEGQYFNYKDIFPKEYKSVSLETKKIKEDIEFLSIHTDRVIEMIFNDNRIEFKANNVNGIFNVEYNIKHGIEEHMGFDKKYMLDVLKTVDSEKIEMGITRRINPIYIKENDNFEYLVLPIRLAS